MDPAWGAMSLSDEETARALCAFQHKEPLPTQRRRPLQPHPEMPQLTAGGRAASGLSAFGYPSTGATYHTAPASLLMGMLSPSTVSDDWQQRQKRTIQGQIEQQQRELQAQMQAQQQREMQAQLEQIQAQIQRQEQLHRQQEQFQQQVERHVGRMQQPSYASEADQSSWGGHLPRAATLKPSGFSDGGKQRAAVQQPTQFYDGGFQRSQPVPMRPATATTTTTMSASAVNCAGSSQVGVLMNGNEETFADQQGQQLAQAHFRTRNTEHFETSALHPWEMSESLPLSEMQVDRTIMPIMQQCVPQQHQQPQPYHPTETRQRCDQEDSMLMHASRVVPDVAFLNGIMRHFPTTGEPRIGVPTTTAASDSVSGMSRDHKHMSTPTPAQFQRRAQNPAKVPRRVDAQSRLPLPPTGRTIVPGVSLASQPTRLLSMRDLLNVEEMASKVAPSRSRPRGSKQQYAAPKRKAQKKTPGNRQRMPQQRNEQRLQRPSNQPNDLLSSQSAGLGLTGASSSFTKPCTPMYLAFMESRAARAIQQTSGITSTKPSVPLVLAPQAQLSTPSSVKSLTQAIEQAVGITTEGATPAEKERSSYKRKRVDTPPGIRCRLATTQPKQQQPVCSNRPKQTATMAEASMGRQEPEFYQVSAIGRALTDKQYELVDDHLRSTGVSDNAMDCVFEQPQQQSAQLSVSDNVQSQNKLESASFTQQAAWNQLSKCDAEQQVTGSLSASLDIPTVSGSNPAFADASSSVTQALALSNPPRVENRTVVIFCKRDFMRYQAAKIWRKYQDQLKKQEDWREVRVAGKRTRYLNSRYADEIRRQHDKINKRAGRPRKKTAQEVQVDCGHEATALAAHADPVEFTRALSKLVNNDDGNSSPPGTSELTAGADSADSGPLSSATEIVSNGKCDDSSPVTVQNAPAKSHVVVTNTRSDGNLKIAATPNPNGVANATSNDNIDHTAGASENNLPVCKAYSDRHIDVSQESLDGNISTSVVGMSPSGPLKVSGAVPDNNVIVRAANEARIDSIDGAAAGAIDSKNSTSSESNIKIGNAVVAAGCNGETDVTACITERSTDESVIPSRMANEQVMNDADRVFGKNRAQPSVENTGPHPLLDEMSAKSKDHCTYLATQGDILSSTLTFDDGATINSVDAAATVSETKDCSTNSCTQGVPTDSTDEVTTNNIDGGAVFETKALATQNGVHA